MSVAPINDCVKPERLAPADQAVDPNAIVRMEELRLQGFSFREIAAVLTRQGLTLSPERIKDIVETCQRKE